MHNFNKWHEHLYNCSDQNLRCHLTLSLLYTLERNNHQFLLRYLLNISWITFLSSSPVTLSIIKTNHLSSELHLWCPRGHPVFPWPHLHLTLTWNLLFTRLIGLKCKCVPYFLTKKPFRGLPIISEKRPRIFHMTYTYLCFLSPCPGHEGTFPLSLSLQHQAISIVTFPRKSSLNSSSQPPQARLGILTNSDQWIFITASDGLHLQLFVNFLILF